MGEDNSRESARVRAVELTLDTPSNRMAELTSLNRRETFVYPIIEMMHGARDMNRKAGTMMGVYRESSYRHKRSLGAQQLIGAHKLAQGEIAAEQKEEEGGEEEEN